MLRVSSRIESVTVFRAGAEVKRGAEISASPDGYAACIRLADLPLSMRDESVQVSIEPLSGASGGGSVSNDDSLPVATEARVVLDVPPPNAALPHSLDAQLRSARRQVRRVADQIHQVRGDLERLARLEIRSRQDAPPGSANSQSPAPEALLTARMSLLSLRRERETGLRQELARLSAEHRDAESALAAIEDQVQQASGARRVQASDLRKALIVRLEGGHVARARLVLRYLVPGARWAPSYVMRLGLAAAMATVSKRAVVAQNTGEDWRGVNLTLTTAEAHGWIPFPELRSWRVGRQAIEIPKIGWRPLPIGVETLYRDYDRDIRDRHVGPSAPRDMTAPPRSGSPHPRAGTERESMGMWSERSTGLPGSAGAGNAVPEDMAPIGESGPAAAGEVDDNRLAGTAREPGRRSSRAATVRPESVSAATTLPLRTFQDPPTLGAPTSENYDALVDAGDELAVPTRIRVRDELLVYGDLRMPPPRSLRRGILRIVEPNEIYREFLASHEMPADVDVAAIVNTARERAEAVTRVPLPRGFREVQRDRYDHTFTADTVVDVPADGSFRPLSLMTRSAAVRMRHVIVPRTSTDVFRQAEVTSPFEEPLLPGPIDIYWDKDFLLTTQMAFTAPGEIVALDLGVEQAVKVARKTGFFEETAGLMRGSRRLCHKIQIEINNSLERPIDCEVRERIPTIREGEPDIEISVNQVVPPWLPYQPAAGSLSEAGLKGGYHWLICVEAKTRKLLEANYEIRISSRNELVGGNCREA